MKVLRLTLLFISFLFVSLAQHIFSEKGTRELGQLPGGLDLPLMPALRSWPIEQQQNLALALAGVGAVLFGSMALAGGRRVIRQVEEESGRGQLGGVIVGGLVALSAGIGLWLLWAMMQDRPDGIFEQSLWLLSLLLFATAAWIGSRREKRRRSKVEMPRPEASWPIFLALLALLSVLLIWRLDVLPIRIDGDPASHGLQAMAILSGEERRMFGPGWAQIPLIAYYPASLGMLFSGDLLIGNRLAGTYAGILSLVGVWLLGCEIFRRPGLPGVDGVSGDDGRTPALIATAALGIGFTFIHFSRIPQYMEPVAWGTLGLWALTRGIRRGDRFTLSVAGMLSALAGVLYYSGRIFGVISLLWWLGYLLYRRSLLAGKRGVGFLGFLFWGGGASLVLAPFIGTWLVEPMRFLQRHREVSMFGADQLRHMEQVYGVEGVQAVLLKNAERIGLTFFLYGDSSTHFGWEWPMLDPISGAFLLLGIGFLVLHLDRLRIWQLLSWFLGVLVLGGMLTLNAPFWPRLMPVLPVAALVVALAADRIWASLESLGGVWLGKTALHLTVGLLVLAGVHNFVRYYEITTVNGDHMSVAARAVYATEPDETPYFLNVDGDVRARWDDRTIDFLAGGRYSDRPRRILDPGDWPQDLPSGSRILLYPRDREISAELEALYPGGSYEVQRNREGNPEIYLYVVP